MQLRTFIIPTTSALSLMLFTGCEPTISITDFTPNSPNSNDAESPLNNENTPNIEQSSANDVEPITGHWTSTSVTYWGEVMPYTYNSTFNGEPYSYTENLEIDLLVHNNLQSEWAQSYSYSYESSSGDSTYDRDTERLNPQVSVISSNRLYLIQSSDRSLDLQCTLTPSDSLDCVSNNNNHNKVNAVTFERTP